MCAADSALPSCSIHKICQKRNCLRSGARPIMKGSRARRQKRVIIICNLSERLSLSWCRVTQSFPRLESVSGGLGAGTRTPLSVSGAHAMRVNEGEKLICRLQAPTLLPPPPPPRRPSPLLIQLE